MLTDPHKMTTDELYKELAEGYAKEAGERDGAAGIFDPSEVYGLAETLAYQEGYDLALALGGGERREAKETETHHLNGAPKLYTAHAISRKGRTLYQGPAFPTRAEAVADAWQNRPNAWEVSSGYGYNGSCHILYSKKG